MFQQLKCQQEDSLCPTRLLAVHESTPGGSQAHDTVIEFSALSDCIANTTHIETLWQLPGAHSEEPEPFDLKHLIKAFAGLCLCKGKSQETTGLFSSIIHSSKPLLSRGPWL